MSGVVRKKFQMTNLTMPNNFYYMKYAIESVPGLADVGVLQVVGDGWVGLHPDVQMGLDIVANHPFHYFQELLFSKICSKDSLWPCPCWGSPRGWGWLGWTSPRWPDRSGNSMVFPPL